MYLVSGTEPSNSRNWKTGGAGHANSNALVRIDCKGQGALLGACEIESDATLRVYYRVRPGDEEQEGYREEGCSYASLATHLLNKGRLRRIGLLRVMSLRQDVSSSPLKFEC